MLLQSYRLEIFNSECMPGAMGVHCFAHLEQDVSEALPYLNAELGGFEYIADPPSVTFKAHGKLITEGKSALDAYLGALAADDDDTRWHPRRIAGGI